MHRTNIQLQQPTTVDREAVWTTVDAAGELPRQARHTPSTRARPLSLIGAPQGRPSTRRRPSAEPGAPARPPSGSDPRELRFAEGRIARVGGGAKLSRRCRSSSGLRAPPLRAAAASAAATSGSLCCGRPRGPWLNAGVSFWVRYLFLTDLSTWTITMTTATLATVSMAAIVAATMPATVTTGRRLCGSD